MNRVKEEFYLSLIFVAKWLALGFGSIFLVYFAVNLMYHKSYYDPMMQKFDFELKELRDKKLIIENQLSSFAITHKNTEEKISIIEKKEIPTVDAKIYNAKNKIESMGLKFWEKCEIPFIERNQQASQACQDLSDAENEKVLAKNRLSSLQSEQSQISTKYQELENEISLLNGQIAQKERDKSQAQVDQKGLLLWLIGILGLGLT